MSLTAEPTPVARESRPSVMTVPLQTWHAFRSGDETVVARCTGPTLDVGCGPGRMAHALATAGVPALGIDISKEAVAQARARGAAALRRDVFGHVPAAGRWHHVLLLDGNVGIGGDPRRVLTRCRASLRGTGTIVTEAEPAGRPTERTWLQLVINGRRTDPLPWARVSVDTVGFLATSMGLEVAARWVSGGRHFLELRRREAG